MKKENRHLNIRLSVEMFKALKKIAEKEFLSISDVVRRAIRKEIK